MINMQLRFLKGSKHIGYIKKIHSRVFYKIRKKCFELKVKAVEENGVIKRVFVSVYSCMR